MKAIKFKHGNFSGSFSPSYVKRFKSQEEFAKDVAEAGTLGTLPDTVKAAIIGDAWKKVHGEAVAPAPKK